MLHMYVYVLCRYFMLVVIDSGYTLKLGMSLFCFYFHLCFFLAILLFLAYYAQYFARSYSILLKV